jgi:Uma2 family endonuclease
VPRTEATLADKRWRDYAALPDDDGRDLVAGRLLRIEHETKWHEATVVGLASALVPWCDRRGLCVLGSRYRVRIDNRNATQADLQVLSEATYRHRRNEDGLERGRPELVVEIVSRASQSHDRVRKVDWYARLGVPEYWIVDPEARMLERLVFHDGVYRVAQHAAGDEVFRPESMGGVKIDLAELWEEL